MKYFIDNIKNFIKNIKFFFEQLYYFRFYNHHDCLDLYIRSLERLEDNLRKKKEFNDFSENYLQDKRAYQIRRYIALLKNLYGIRDIFCDKYSNIEEYYEECDRAFKNWKKDIDKIFSDIPNLSYIKKVDIIKNRIKKNPKYAKIFSEKYEGFDLNNEYDMDIAIDIEISNGKGVFNWYS